MAIDPSISLGIRPPVIPVPDIQSPLDRFTKVLSLRNLMTEGQSGQIGLQAQQLKLQEAQQQQQDDATLRQKYAANPNLTDADLISAIGPVRAIPLIKAKSEQLQQFYKTEKERAETLGSLAGSAVDKDSAIRAVMDGVSRRAFATDEAKNSAIGRQLLDHLNTNGFNPAEFKQYQWEAMQAAQQNSAALAAEEAKRQQAESNARLPGITADSTTKVRQMDASTLAAAIAKGPEAFQAALAALPTQERRTPFEDAKDAMDVYRRGLTPDQAVTTGQQAATQAQTQSTAVANIEGKLRDDYTQATKTFPTIREAYGRIQAAKGAPPSGASDIALLYGYMKVLDPGSTVREGEFATASNAGGIPDRLVAMYNQILRGDRLSPNVRTEMMDNVERLYGRATEDYNKTTQQFTDIAKRSNVDPRNVIIDYTSTFKPATTTAGTGEAPTGSTPAWKQTKVGDEPKLVWYGPDGKEYTKPPKAPAPGAPATQANPQQRGTNPNPTGYVPGHVYGGKTYLGGDPFTAASWR